MVIGSEEFTLSNAIDRELYKMSTIWRYNSRLIQKPENLAEHSFYVTFKVYELGHKFNVPENIISKAAKVALCHDCGEIYTGDLPHCLKIYSPKIKEIAEELEVEMMQKYFPQFADEFTAFANKEDKLINCLVDTADCIDVLMFIDREEQLGNKNEDIVQIRYEASERYINLIKKLTELTAEYNKEK